MEGLKFIDFARWFGLMYFYFYVDDMRYPLFGFGLDLFT
jgi:hypothetical protein